MKLNDLPFNQIKEGSKTIEVRLNDQKRKTLEVGDYIIFSNTKNNEKLEKKIISLNNYDTFRQLFNSFDSSFNWFKVFLAATNSL